MLEISVSNIVPVPSFALRSVVREWRGDWTTATSYALFDIVAHNGSSYIAISGHISGASTEPGIGASWETVWGLQAESGEDGDDFVIAGIVANNAARDSQFGNFPVGTIILVNAPAAPFDSGPHIFRLITPHVSTPVWSDGSPFSGAAAVLASQAEAEAGTDNAKTMTPLRTKQQIDARRASQAEAEAGTDANKLLTVLQGAQQFDERLSALPGDGTEADPVIARGGSGIQFGTATRKLNIVTGIKGDATYPPEIGFVFQRVAGGHKIGVAENFDSGLWPFGIDTSQGSPKIIAEGYILAGADDAIDRGMRRYNGTAAAPRGLDTTDIGHIADRDYTQFAGIWSDGEGVSAPAPWFPPEHKLVRPIPATGSILSDGSFTLRYRQHTSGLPVTPIDGHPYFIRIMDMAQASIPVLGKFNFNGTNYYYKRNDGTQFASGNVPQEGIWRYHTISNTFRADVNSDTDLGGTSLNLSYRTSVGGAKLPFFERSWSRTTWVPSAPFGPNREGLVTFEVAQRNEGVPRVSMCMGGKGMLFPGGSFYHDRVDTDGFYAPDIYPRVGQVGPAGPFYNSGTDTILDPSQSDNTDAISPGVAAGVNHLRLWAMGSASFLGSHHTRFPVITLTEGVAPDKGIHLAHDTGTHELIIKGVDRGSAETLEALILDELGNINLKIPGSSTKEQDVCFVAGNTSKVNGFWSISPTSVNEFSLKGSKLSTVGSPSELSAAQAAIGTTTVAFISTTELARIGYSGAKKNEWEFKQDVTFDADLDVGAFSATGVTAGKQALSGNSHRLDSSRVGTGSAAHSHFYNGNGLVGSITTAGSATSFVTSSDERLKENFLPIDSGPLIDGMSFYKFNWISDPASEGFGPKAQELYEIFPNAVLVGGADPVAEPWGYDASKLVPILMAELKALRARVAALEALP